MRKTRIIGISAGVAAVVIGGLWWGLVRRAAYNVLLITLDTTRADHLGCYGYADAVTPALDELARQGVVFEQAITLTPLTQPSHTTMLTGLAPPETGIRTNGRKSLAADIPILPEILRARGYRTGAFIAAAVLVSKFGLNRGFDVYDDDLSAAYDKKSHTVKYRSGRLVADAALQWLEKAADSPFFCWVHFYDPHEPQFAHTELAGTRYMGDASYDSEIAFMDMQVRRLTDFLKKRGLDRRTLVIAVADHGESLDEHGEATHGHMLYDGTQRIPLIMSLAGKVRAGHRAGSMVSLADLFPTILDVVGAKNPGQGLGRSLRPALRGEEIAGSVCYAETMMPYERFGWSPVWALVTDEFKYIRTPRVELYDRRTDPKEASNLAAGRPEKVEELEAELKGLESEMVLRSADEVQLQTDEKRRLEALGYVRGGKDFDEEKSDYAKLRDIKDVIGVVGAVSFMWMLDERGEHEKQVRLCLEMVKRSPESAELNYFLGEALRKDGKEEESIPSYLKAVEIDPQHMDSLGRLAKLLTVRGRYEEAIKHSEEMIKVAPDQPDPDALNDLGYALFNLGKMEESGKYLQRAIEIDPKFAMAHYNLGVLREKQGDWAAALAQYEEAANLDPEDAKARFGLAQALLQAGKAGEAAAQYREVVRLKPDDIPARIRLADALVAGGQADQVEGVFRSGLEAVPDDPLLLRALGVNLLLKRSWPDAEGCFRRLLEKGTGVAWTDHYYLGQALLGQKREPEALAALNEAIRKDSPATVARQQVGSLLADGGLYNNAVEVLRAGLADRPEDAILANSLAWVLATCPHASLRNGAEAVKLAEAIQAKLPGTEAGLLDTLAAAYAEAGRFEDAVNAGEKALTAAKKAGQKPLESEIEKRLAMYRQGQPYRDKPSTQQ